MPVSFPYDYDFHPPAPVVEVTVRWKERHVTLSALVDSGADASMLPVNVLREIGAEFVETRRVLGISGVARTADLYTVILRIGPHEVAGIRVISRQPNSEAIIGRDMLNQLIVVLDGIGGIVEVS